MGLGRSLGGLLAGAVARAMVMHEGESGRLAPIRVPSRQRGLVAQARSNVAVEVDAGCDFAGGGVCNRAERR